MTFREAYSMVDDLLQRWGENGIYIAGETQDEWIFKGHVVPEDDLSGSCIIVRKSDGEIRLFNVGRWEDREVARSATMIKEPMYSVKDAQVNTTIRE